MKKYRIFVSDGFNLNGSRRRFSKTVETELTGRNLERFLTIKKYEFEDEVKKSNPKFHNLRSKSFKEYTIFWLDYKATHDNITPKTKEWYEKLLYPRIIDIIGNKRLDGLDNGDMLELIKSIKESTADTESGKLSDKSVKHYHTLLKTMFNDAVKLKIISENPMDNIPIKTPRVKLKDNYYDLEDVRKLLDLLPMEPLKYQLATIIALSVGLRIGELTALQWKHIDFERHQLRIEQSNSYTKEQGSVIKNTKNTYSDRTVAFPKTLVDLFKAHREEELSKKKLMGKRWYNKTNDPLEDFVFTQEDGKTIFIGTIPKWFRDFIREHELKYISFHGLRHTNTTILINKGINIVSISHSLGHAKTSTTTDFYAHHLESVERKMANTFDDIMASGTQSGTKDKNLRVVK